MNQAAIIHRPTSDYIYPSSRNTLELQLITARADADEVELWYWMRYETDPAKIRRQRLHVSLQDALHDYYRTTVCTGQIAAYTRYCFHLKAGTDELWLGANGLQDTEPHMNGNFFEFLWPNPTDGFSAPAWRSRQVYYQIFPERFKNGDSSRTPPGAEAWGSAPTRENFMGGDLAGIAQQLDYIQSLGATCLYLTPIFRAPSNHKYDTVDYFEIDPAFGTRDDLRRLVDGVHARGMRIILDGVFNHCGYWWDKFQDVVKNGKASPYCSWFFIHSYPVDAEQQNYDCVGHYKWMPKLNLANPDARDYFLSVGRYWLEEFGIDGWRLDVADELPTAFLEAFAAAMRAYKPDCILLGETWGDAGRLVSANRLDSHDTARFLYEASGDKARLRLAAALQMTFPGSPAIFYGDEVGLSGPNDPGCRMAMQWDAEQQDRRLLRWYRRLIQLRLASDSLTDGDFHTVLADDAANVYAFSRAVPGEQTLVVLHAGTAHWRGQFPIPDWAREFAAWTLCCQTGGMTEDDPFHPTILTDDPGRFEAELPARSVKIIRFINKKLKEKVQS